MGISCRSGARTVIRIISKGTLGMQLINMQTWPSDGWPLPTVDGVGLFATVLCFRALFVAMQAYLACKQSIQRLGGLPPQAFNVALRESHDILSCFAMMRGGAKSVEQLLPDVCGDLKWKCDKRLRVIGDKYRNSPAKFGSWSGPGPTISCPHTKSLAGQATSRTYMSNLPFRAVGVHEVPMHPLGVLSSVSHRAYPCSQVEPRSQGELLELDRFQNCPVLSYPWTSVLSRQERNMVLCR